MKLSLIRLVNVYDFHELLIVFRNIFIGELWTSEYHRGKSFAK